MRIGLVSETFVDGDVEFNSNQIKKRLIEGSGMGLDLICFGESFLQGFGGLTWDFSKDSSRALCRDGETIISLREAAKQHGVGLSFGYFEKQGKAIYCSYLVISHEGEILDNYRRMSRGWKEPTAADSHYREGGELSVFTYRGKRFATAICGDLWDDDNIRAAEQLDIDCMLWPNYVDYTVEKWESGEKAEYADHVQGIPAPVLMINSYVEGENLAKGGCSVFRDGVIVQELPMGELGVLVYEF